MKSLNFSWLLLTILMVAVAPPARADVCVWRDPERTMEKLFPQASDYKTRTVKMTPPRIAAIEQALGMPLESTERKEFDLYDINGAVGGKSQKLGTVLALAGKGEYGSIEVVIGIGNNGKVIGAYIQRTRERASASIQSPEFLKQFVGKTNGSGFDVKPTSPDAEKASRVVAFVIKKMLVFNDVLSKGD